MVLPRLVIAFNFTNFNIEIGSFFDFGNLTVTDPYNSIGHIYHFVIVGSRNDCYAFIFIQFAQKFYNLSTSF